MSEPIFSIRIDDQGREHTKVSLFNRGGLAGQMTILSADVPEFLRRLVGRLVEPSPADKLFGYLGESESTKAQADRIDVENLVFKLRQMQDGANVHTINKAVFHLRSLSGPGWIKDDSERLRVLDVLVQTCHAAISTSQVDELAFLMRRWF